ncbi:MAG: polymer-forming cytoskeletal protein [Anaerolineae bacterium]|nr:polymer-forming cytoskeletal protein [Anaerolineae bacterium]
MSVLKRRKPKPPPPGQAETVIGPTTNFKGTIQNDGGLRVEGVIEGLVETGGNFIISEEATVIADVVAYNVSVAGLVKGNIKANRVEILSTGRIWGDVTVKSFLVDEGGFVCGEIIMEGAEFKPPITKSPRPAPKTADVEKDESA